MKNRRITIVAFLLIAALTLGIGYAALTDTLTITGSASVDAEAGQNAFEDDIYFSAAQGGTDVVAEFDDDTATMEIAEGKTPLKVVGDKITATFTVKSDSDLNATVTASVKSNSNEEFFKVTTDWTTENLAANGTLDITVTVELIKTPDNNQAETTSFTVQLDVASVD